MRTADYADSLWAGRLHLDISSPYLYANIVRRRFKTKPTILGLLSDIDSTAKVCQISGRHSPNAIGKHIWRLISIDGALMAIGITGFEISGRDDAVYT